MENVYIFVLSLCGAVIRVHSLECYVCSNCPTVSPNQVKSCDGMTTSTVSPSIPSTTTPWHTNTTTSAPKTPSEDPITPNPTYPSTPYPTFPTASKDTDSNSTTEVPSNHNAKTSTTLEGHATTNFKTTSKQDDGKGRNWRSADDDTYKGCVCQNEICDCGGRRFTTIADHTKLKAIQYQCFKYVDTVNGKEIVHRGCQAVFENSNSTACSILNLSNCSSCTTEKCNSASYMQFSIALIIFALSTLFV